MTPCTEEVVRSAIERSIGRPLIVLEMPKGKELTAGESLPGEDQSDDVCPGCGASAEEHCAEGCPNA
jgi:hypothetical protein